MEQNQQKNKSLLHDRNLHIIFLITLMAVLGVSSITPAFPKIAAQLDIPKKSIGLLIITFTLPGVFLTPVLGVLADRLGRKRVLAPSLFLFAIAGGLCGFVRDFHVLLILRFIQGLGAAALGSLNITIIGDLFEGKKRITAMGYNASVLSIATASYPFIGGALAAIAWYLPFFLPFFAVPVGLAVIFGLQTREPSRAQHLRDYLGSALKSVKRLRVILYFSVSMMIFIILYGSYLTYLPIFLAERFRFDSLEIGLVMSVMSIVTAITAAQGGRIASILNEHWMMRLAFGFYALAMLIFPFSGSVPALLLPIIFFGIGQGMNMPAIQTLLTSLAPLEYRAAFMSLNGMVLRLGQTLGPLIMGFVYAGAGLSATFYAGAVCAIIMGTLLMIFDHARDKSAKNEFN